MPPAGPRASATTIERVAAARAELEAAEADEDQVTDAADRLAEFEGVSFLNDPIDGVPLDDGDA